MIFLKSLFLLLTLVPPIYAQSVKTIRLCEKDVGKILISPQGTMINFPVEPEEVFLGSQKTFSVKYKHSDLIVSPLFSNAQSNLFVYLQGRRFTISLLTSIKGGVTNCFVKDCQEDRVKPRGK